MDCYTNHFLGLPCFKKLTADKHVLAELPLVPFEFINFTRLTVGVCMKVRFKSKVTRDFSFSPLRSRLFHEKKNQEKPLVPGYRTNCSVSILRVKFPCSFLNPTRTNQRPFHNCLEKNIMMILEKNKYSKLCPLN